MDNSRPEQLLFTYQSSLLDRSNDLLDVTLKPKAFAFAQAGFGRPGLNFLDDQAQGFYMVGLKVKWNLWDWNKTNYSKQQLSIRQKIITTQKEAFDINVNAALVQKKNEMDKLEKLIIKDEELIALRTSIKETASHKLNGGIITVTDYLIKLNAESSSKLNNNVRVMELELAKIDYLMILGKEIVQ
jgi:outer membrane protein TolC